MDEKTEKLNSDIYKEDFELLTHIMEEQKLSSRKEGLRFIFNSYRGIPQADSERNKCTCENLSDEYCVRDYPKLKKTDAVQCRACQKARKLKEEEYFRNDEWCVLEHRFWERIGVPFGICDPFTRINYAETYIAKKDAEIEELRKPNEALLTAKSNLDTEFQNMKNALVASLEAGAVLETDNAQLRQHLEELSHDSLLEKNAVLTVQLGQKEQTIADLTSEVEKQEALINSQKQTVFEMASRTSKMLREFRQYQPSTLEPYNISTYLNNLQKKIADFEGYMNTVTV